LSVDAQYGFSEKWANVDGLRVRFLHAGSGPPLALVHGLLGYSANWRRVIPGLAEKYEVFAPDLPGSGLSDCSPELDCRLSSAGGRLLRFLDTVGIGPCDLVGSSYGGATAVIAAARERLRFRRLVLVSPANPWSRFGRKRIMLLQLPGVGAIFPPVGRWTRPLQTYFLRRMYGDSSLITDETLTSHFVSIRRPGILEHGVKILDTWSEDMWAMKAALAAVSSIPTLIIWGSRDRTVDPASAKPLSQHFKSVEVKIIEGAGHLPYEESPERFTPIVLDFLASEHFTAAGSKQVVT
jgi:pimeloyl-ACP methyl ester carboxylesterase